MTSRHLGLVLLVVTVVSCAKGGCKNGESSQNSVKPRGGEDLIVFIAREKPTLYRLVGTTPVSWGTATFNSPTSLVADPKQRCFFVLDRPRYIYQPFKVWRIEADRKASVFFEGKREKDGKPFASLLGLMLDAEGNLFIVDGTSGVWRLDNNRRVHQLLDGDKPLRMFTADEPHLLRGVAKWSDDTHLIADPDADVKGVSGTGGLFLFRSDGTRELLAAFGQRIQPLGVAILRGATKSPPTPVGKSPGCPAAKLNLRDLVGVHRAGRITRVSIASYERQTQSPYDVSSPLYGLGRKWEVQPKDAAMSRLTALFEGARWEIKEDGTFLFSPPRVEPQDRTHLLALAGSVKPETETVLAYARYSPQSNFDLQSASVDAVMQAPRKGELVMSLEVNVSGDDERLKATFEQVLRLGTPD